MPRFREPSRFWRRARRRHRFGLQPDAPEGLPPGSAVRVPGRGEMFVRYRPGPAGAPTVLLLHGWMASADLNWLGAYDKFADRYHVLAVDHRGHGRGIRSYEAFTLEDCADDVAGLLGVLGVRRVIAVGYSMGGPIAMLLARRHPHRVSGLVMAATASDFGRDGLNRFMDPAVRFLNPLFRLGLPDMGLRVAGRRRLEVLGELMDSVPWMAGEMKRLHPADISGAGRALARFDARPWLEELAVPAASVITTRDRGVKPEEQRQLAAGLGARIVELDAGHTACTSAPDELGWAVRAAVDIVGSEIGDGLVASWRGSRWRWTQSAPRRPRVPASASGW